MHFTVSDQCGNNVSTTAAVRFADEEEPRIELYGGTDVITDYGHPFVDPHVKVAADRCHGELLANVTTVSNVNTTRLGNYTVEYEVTDACGFLATATREVTVADLEPPVIEGRGKDVLFVRAGSMYTDAGVDVHDNVWPRSEIEVEAFGVSAGGNSFALDSMMTVPDVSAFSSVYTARDGAGNEAAAAVRLVHVLAAPTHDTDTTEATFTFSAALVEQLLQGAGDSSSSDGGDGGDATAYSLVRVVVTASGNGNGDVDADELRLLLGGEMNGHTTVAADEATGRYEVLALLNAHAASVVHVARQSAHVHAVGGPARVLEYQGSTRDLDWFCGDGAEVLQEYTVRYARELYDVQCDTCNCIYKTATPSPVEGEFDAPHLAESIHWEVTVEALYDGETIDLDALRERLLVFGVLPVRMQFVEDSGERRATVITRSRVPHGPHALLPARVRIVQKRAIVATQLTLWAAAATTKFELRMELLAVGVVPESISMVADLVESTGEEVKRVTVTTRNDISHETLFWLNGINVHPDTVVSVAYTEPAPYQEVQWPYEYTATASDAGNTVSVLWPVVRCLFLFVAVVVVVCGASCFRGMCSCAD